MSFLTVTSICVENVLKHEEHTRYYDVPTIWSMNMNTNPATINMNPTSTEFQNNKTNKHWKYIENKCTITNVTHTWPLVWEHKSTHMWIPLFNYVGRFLCLWENCNPKNKISKKWFFHSPSLNIFSVFLDVRFFLCDCSLKATIFFSVVFADTSPL